MDEFEEIAKGKKRPTPGERWEGCLGVAARLTLLIVLVLCGIVAFVDWAQRRVSYAPRAQCVNNLKMIGLALHEYHNAYGSFPPAYVADAEGRPMHSWRVLILPFLEGQKLYDRYNFQEPWDGPNNIKLLDEMPRSYACPRSHDEAPTTLTSYVAITGGGTVFPGSTPAKLADVTDGPNKTIIVVETSNIDIPWTSPRDLDPALMSLRINEPKLPGISSKHPDGANAAFADGSVRFLRETTPN